MTLMLATEFYVITCCHQGCGVHFAVPDHWDTKRRRDHTSFWCPNGHPQSYSAKSDLERLQAEKLRLESQLEFERKRKSEIAEERDKVERRLKATKGHMTRIRRRVEHGVCIHCNRTFTDLQRHMSSKHADVVDARGE